jgi:hypothetical protein
LAPSVYASWFKQSKRNASKKENMHARKIFVYKKLFKQKNIDKAPTKPQKSLIQRFLTKL